MWIGNLTPLFQTDTDNIHTHLHRMPREMGQHQGVDLFRNLVSCVMADASLLTTDARYLQAEGKECSAVIHDFAGLAGPYDFVPTDRDLVDLFGLPSQYPLMRASTFVDGHQPPMLLMGGADDTLVGRANRDRLAASVREKGGCVATRIYPGVDHIWLVASLSWLGRGKAPVVRDMTNFFSSVTKGPCD